MATETLEPYLVETLKKSAWEILETMVFLTPSSVDALPEDESTFGEEVVGLLGFTGTRSGTFVVRTSQQLASTMAAKMMMMEPGELSGTDEVADAFGEIVNMLSGNFKNAWVENGNQMDLSVPNVIFRGRVSINSDHSTCLRSRIRVSIESEVLDIGVHFEAQD